MYSLYEDYLFTKNILVNCDGEKKDVFPCLYALANLFGIRVVSGQNLASLNMVKTAERVLGISVPRAFYTGFPRSVREMTPEQRLFDQLYYYYTTYYLDNWTAEGSSLFDTEFRRTAFKEKTEVRDFVIITEDEAEEKLVQMAENLLRSTRPLNEEQYALVKNVVEDFGYCMSDELVIAGKDTATRLLMDLPGIMLNRYFSGMIGGLQLSDVIRLVELIQEEHYGGADILHLNLRNRDRKLITQVLDWFFREHPENCNVTACYEKRKQWNGLLHHIHYKPVNDEAEAFLEAMRGGENKSVYAAFEQAMDNWDVENAVQILKKGKGSGAVLRNLMYILSRCYGEEEIGYVLDSIETGNPLVLMQLIEALTNDDDSQLRTFRFTKFRTMRVHNETEEEAGSRQTRLPEEVRAQVKQALEQKLAQVLSGKLGKVYIDPKLRKVALPMQETASSGGYGVLPRGSRIPIKAEKKIRGFTYWEKVSDIDLSVIGTNHRGNQIEFSWRGMYSRQSDAITFSGDITDGYMGGSEFFDVDLEAFREMYPNVEYLIFCNNVYSGFPFSDCLCKAGYMTRDIEDSGEIFEPKTVATSFRITANSTFAYLFAVDLAKNELVWLNTSRKSSSRVAGATSLDFLLRYLEKEPVFNLEHFFTLLASQMVTNPREADVVVSDGQLPLKEGAEQIHSWDFERMLALMNNKG